MQEQIPQLISLFAVLFCTNFTKVFTVLTFFRFGLGIKAQGYGVIIFGLSIAIAIFDMDTAPTPAGQKSNSHKFEEVLKPSSISIEERYRQYIEANIDSAILSKVVNLKPVENISNNKIENDPETKKPEQFSTLLTAFQLTQLKSGFLLGLIILIPFILIDLLVANVITAIGIKELSSETISLVIKLILFLSVGGWELLAGKIISNL